MQCVLVFACILWNHFWNVVAFVVVLPHVTALFLVYIFVNAVVCIPFLESIIVSVDGDSKRTHKWRKEQKKIMQQEHTVQRVCVCIGASWDLSYITEEEVIRSNGTNRTMNMKKNCKLTQKKKQTEKIEGKKTWQRLKWVKCESEYKLTNREIFECYIVLTITIVICLLFLFLGFFFLLFNLSLLHPSFSLSLYFYLCSSAFDWFIHLLILRHAFKNLQILYLHGHWTTSFLHTIYSMGSLASNPCRMLFFFEKQRPVKE